MNLFPKNLSAAGKNSYQIAIHVVLRKKTDLFLNLIQYIKSFVFVELIQKDVLKTILDHSMARIQEEAKVLRLRRLTKKCVKAPRQISCLL